MGQSSRAIGSRQAGEEALVGHHGESERLQGGTLAQRARRQPVHEGLVTGLRRAPLEVAEPALGVAAVYLGALRQQAAELDAVPEALLPRVEVVGVRGVHRRAALRGPVPAEGVVVLEGEA